MAEQNVQPGNLQAALETHERNKRTTDIPLFYGNPTLDRISPLDLIERIEAAAKVGTTFDDARKCVELELCTRDAAKGWWRAVKSSRKVDMTNWAQVKDSFFKTFDPRATARHTCTLLADTKKKPAESMVRFYGRISEQFDKIVAQAPAHCLNPIPADGAFPMTEENARKMLTRACMDYNQHIQKLVFVSGLPDDVRQEVMRNDSDDQGSWEIFQTALSAEILLEDGKKKNVHPVRVEAVHEKKTVDDVDVEEFDDENHFEAVNLLRTRRGLPPRPQPAFFKAMKKTGPSNGGIHRNRNGRPIMKCRYPKCGKMGHMQKDCRMRISDGAPCLDQFGQPWRNQPSVHSVNEAEDSPVHLNLLRIV